ncbi:uncharacterized protein LOC144302453 isoform X1 [Canis aureus]
MLKYKLVCRGLPDSHDISLMDVSLVIFSIPAKDMERTFKTAERRSCPRMERKKYITSSVCPQAFLGAYEGIENLWELAWIFLGFKIVRGYSPKWCQTSSKAETDSQQQPKVPRMTSPLPLISAPGAVYLSLAFHCRRASGAPKAKYSRYSQSVRYDNFSINGLLFVNIIAKKIETIFSKTSFVF